MQAPVEVVAQTYVTAASFDIVLNSTGAVLALIDEVVEQSKVRGCSWCATQTFVQLFLLAYDQQQTSCSLVHTSVLQEDRV